MIKVNLDVEIKFILLVHGGSWSVQTKTDLDLGGPETYGSRYRTLHFLHPGAPHRPDFLLTYLPEEKKNCCIFAFVFSFHIIGTVPYSVALKWRHEMLGYSIRTKRTKILLCNLRWNSWKYNFFEVSEHNLEIFQNWGFHLSFYLSTKGYSWTNLSFLHWWIVLFGFLKP